MSKQLKSFVALISVLIFSISLTTVCGTAFTENITYYTFNGNAYEIVSTNSTYNSAINTCNKKGGHIVYINSAAEQAFVAGMISSGRYWIGATYSAASGWTWGGGNAVLYSNWEGDTPNSSTQAYAFIDGSTGKWVNTNRSSSYAIIIEYEGGATKVNSQNETNNENMTTSQHDDPGEVTSVTSTDTSDVSSEGDTSDYTTTPRQAVSIVYVRETAPSGFTLPSADITNPIEEETRNVLEGIDIGDTIYIYEDTYYYQIANASEILISYYVGVNEDITIPQTIDDMPVKYIGPRAFQSKMLRSATIPSTVSIIDPTAFCNIAGNFTIYAERDSAAQAFANENKYNFSETSFFDNGNSNSTPGQDGNQNDDDSNQRLTFIIVILVGVVLAAALIAFFVVRRERILVAAEDKKTAEESKPKYTVEYDEDDK